MGDDELWGGDLGWKVREKMEGVHERYLRWVLGVDWCTPGYLVREELQRDRLKGRAGLRAWGYERKLEEGQGGELARMCWEEIKGRAKRGKALGEWEGERRGFFEERGWTVEGLERMREVGEMRGEELVRREKKLQEAERWERIRESKFNRWYGAIKGVGVPGYLKKGWGECRWRRVARFRLGCEMRGGRYWEEEEKRKCRVCAWGDETWEHVWEECTGWGDGRGWQEVVGEVMDDEGGGEEWMRRVEEWRGG